MKQQQKKLKTKKLGKIMNVECDIAEITNNNHISKLTATLNILTQSSETLMQFYCMKKKIFFFLAGLLYNLKNMFYKQTVLIWVLTLFSYRPKIRKISCQCNH